MNVAFNRLWISNLNLRPYTLSILMWPQTKFRQTDRQTGRLVDVLCYDPNSRDRIRVLIGFKFEFEFVADLTDDPFCVVFVERQSGPESDTQIPIWIVYETINGHIYFMFMLIFSSLIKKKKSEEKIFVSFHIYVNATRFPLRRKASSSSSVISEPIIINGAVSRRCSTRQHSFKCHLCILLTFSSRILSLARRYARRYRQAWRFGYPARAPFKSWWQLHDSQIKIACSFWMISGYRCIRPISHD